MLWRKLGRDLFARKSTLLTLISIVAVGIGGFVGMSGVYRDLDGARRSYYAAYRLTDLQVDLKRAPLTSIQDIEALPNVREVHVRVSLPVLLDIRGRSEPVSGTALSLPSTRRPVWLDDNLVLSDELLPVVEIEE